MAQTDEAHVRDTLRIHNAVLASMCTHPSIPEHVRESWLSDLDTALAHIKAIRVRGDSKRKAPDIERVTTFEWGDVPTYTKDGDRVS